MAKTPIHERVYTRLNLNTDMDRIRGRIDAELTEMMADGIPISFCDPAHNGRLVRKYPNGNKVFLVRDEHKILCEIPIDAGSQAE